MGLRSKAKEDIEHEAKKVSPIGNDVLGELVRSGVLTEKRAGMRRSLEVSDKAAVSLFIQQSITRGKMATAVEQLVRRHLKTGRQ
jgi:hypothetical protein